ncbi:DUF1501 domain-containing protein [Derxia gummosa]|uniref:DUF1501 domain-containing protein n=1 Tax=Derxia gummosa DSM 723 TaxID=1121388 RepID=A0A8B6X5Z1_9BURK|nr:DUF1501 domain-containing protein [Derxia gummosa]
MDRRQLLKALALGGAGLALPVGRDAWAALGPLGGASGLAGLAGAAGADAAADGNAARAGRAPRLIVVFLRGAIDGLNIVVPWSEADYARRRPSIALAAPGKDGGVLDLDGHFGLHPALEPLLPLWQAGQLGFVHASGSADETRSHFDAQFFMESGTPGRRSTPDGWLNRLLGGLPASAAQQAAPVRAVSVGAVLPQIWAGREPVATLASGRAAVAPSVLDKPAVADAFDRLYAGDDPLARAYRKGQDARREVLDLNNPADLEREMTAANNGAPLPTGFAEDCRRLATMMRKDARVQFGFLAVGGWDTHTQQGAAGGHLATRSGQLARGLALLPEALGPVWQDTVVMVMSEFGRTAAENGNRGTDHGHGNVMWLLGAPVAGGKVHGRWPGIDDAGLHEKRDLAVTTDFRDVAAVLAERHLRLADAKLDAVFPGFRPGDGAGAEVLRG